MEEFGEAIETDLLLAGYRLDDLGVVFSWRDLLLLVRRFAQTAGSAFQVARTGQSVPDIGTQVLFEIFDVLARANYQRGGGRGAKPKPLPRPWKKPAGKRFGFGGIPASEFDEWWDSFSKGD